MIAARGAASGARYGVVYRGARVPSGFRLEILGLDGSRTWAVAKLAAARP